MIATGMCGLTARLEIIQLTYMDDRSTDDHGRVVLVHCWLWLGQPV